MNRIKKLDAQTINQIAAGEVVERPSSAIKELVDNSIDAGATVISVEILSVDCRSFRVTDNGSGINPEDIELAFAPHATSKLSSHEDLENIVTMGFRGEALSTISSVAKVVCITKTLSMEHALKAVVNEDGKIQTSPHAHQQGTTFEVYDLFGNVPVRLRFLKKPETEFQIIQETIKELAVANSNIAFVLKYKNKVVLQTSGSGNWSKTVKEALGESGGKFKYIEVSKDDPQIELKGLTGSLSDARNDAKGIITLVNNRPIKCDVMRKAIRAAYQGYLIGGKHPRAVISLSIPPSQVDVNVHPTKKEVRYAAPNIVYQTVFSALEKNLLIQSSFSQPKEDVLDIKPEQKVLPSNLQPKLPEVKNFTPKEQFFIKPQEPLPESFFEPKTEPTFKIHEQVLSKVEDLADKTSVREERGVATEFRLIEGEHVLSGKVSGPKWMREKYLLSMGNFLRELQDEVVEREEYKQTTFVERTNSFTRPKPPLSLLETIWERDNWQCVYCGKHLVHPSIAKQNMRYDPDSWISRLGSGNKIIKTHLLREHLASYDHHLPYSHNKSLALTEDNLYACCRSCNQEKSNSTNSYKWVIQRRPKITLPVKIGNFEYLNGKSVMQTIGKNSY
jgi:DNA mismatch repair protein MutL